MKPEPAIGGIIVNDVMHVYEVSKRTAYGKLKDMRMRYQIEKHQPITITHFSEYTGVEEPRLINFVIQGRRSSGLIN